MGEWKNELLENLCKHMQSGGTPKSDVPDFYNGEIPFVAIEDLTASSKYLWKTKKHLSKKGIENSAAWLVPKNSLMYSIYATLGVPVINKVEVSTNQAILNLIVDSDKADIEYLYYYLLFIKNDIHKHSAQTTQSNLNAKIVKSFQIHLPPTVEEQSTIATILSTIDQAIEKTEQLIAKYERIKTGLMQDLLTRGIDEQGNIRSEETHEFKDSPLGRIPREWKFGTIGKDCKIQNSFRKPLSAEVRENMKGKYPYYGPTGILDYINEYRVEGKYVLIGEDGDHFLKFVSQEMTLLVEGKFNVNNHAHILEGKDECITEWIHCFFCHRDITFHLTRQGAGRFKLNKATLSNLPIAVPNKGEQLRIIEKVDRIRNYLQGEKETLNNFRMLKAGLMQDLLTGKVRVNKLIENVQTGTY